MAKIQIDWVKYFEDSRSLPLESARNPKNGLIALCVSKRALETYINLVMEAGKDEARMSGQTYGAIERKKLVDNMNSVVDILVEDEDVYNFNPEFYGPYLVKS